ncbi:metal-dependent phosphohydrolase [Nodularia phage vB_NspS-kac68v161]|nr:metal-dependent phosphohydrolase [Nodularia phage vB_NspS-kac68v161]QBQ73820.1 HD domain-containing protein [Nodularia phage vB_NspS-kac68v161]
MYGELPYHRHLNNVVNILKQSGCDDDTLLAAAWLHDVLEDTDTTDEELVDVFGSEVANIVNAVTGVGNNRKEKLENIASKIKACPAALPVKLADRIANMEASRQNNEKLYKMYRHELPRFTALLSDTTKPENEHPLLWGGLKDMFLGYN